jgi:hypothetical protein
LTSGVRARVICTAAHIMLLESLPFIRHFISLNRHYFE